MHFTLLGVLYFCIINIPGLYAEIPGNCLETLKLLESGFILSGFSG